MAENYRVSPASPSLFMTADELAALLNVSKRTIWRMKVLGTLPQAVRLGRSVRWQRSAVLEWIERGCPAADHALGNLLSSFAGSR